MHTGDVVTVDGAGRVTFRSRLKDMLKVGGENVAAAEIEDHLLTHPAVGVVAVVAAPDDRYVEVPAAFVQLAPGAHATPEELVAHCVGRIAAFRVPRYVRFVDEWPMSGTKIRKVDLRARIAEEIEERDAHRAASSARAVTSSVVRARSPGRAVLQARQFAGEGVAGIATRKRRRRRALATPRQSASPRPGRRQTPGSGRRPAPMAHTQDLVVGLRLLIADALAAPAAPRPPSPRSAWWRWWSWSSRRSRRGRRSEHDPGQRIVSCCPGTMWFGLDSPFCAASELAVVPWAVAIPESVSPGRTV